MRGADGNITVFDPAGSCGGGFCATFVSGINGKGSISGTYYNRNSVGRGYLRTADGRITTFGVPKTDLTQAEHINNNGLVAGSWFKNIKSDQQHGFFWSR